MNRPDQKLSLSLEMTATVAPGVLDAVISAFIAFSISAIFSGATTCDRIDCTLKKMAKTAKIESDLEKIKYR